MDHSPVGKTVALYSGGVDSFCMAALERPDVLLTVNMGGRYGDAEQAHLTPPPNFRGRVERVSLDLGQWELPGNMIIPGRNATLALAAANYGDRIIMGSVAKSRGNDKDDEFARRMTRLLAYIYAPQPLWLPEGRNVRLELPIYELTKTQLVAKTIAAGVPGEAVRDSTFSCYTPTADGRECGSCKPCGRKWAALAANGVQPTVDGRKAFRPYVDEIADGDPYGRGPAYAAEVLAAWNSIY